MFLAADAAANFLWYATPSGVAMNLTIRRFDVQLRQAVCPTLNISTGLAVTCFPHPQRNEYLFFAPRISPSGMSSFKLLFFRSVCNRDRVTSLCCNS